MGRTTLRVNQSTCFQTRLLARGLGLSFMHLPPERLRPWSITSMHKQP
ncbi:hypothetical protein [Scytonema sp. HK-05]